MSKTKNDNIKNAITDLKYARALIRGRGKWIKGTYDNGQQVCSVGAIQRAYRTRVSGHERYSCNGYDQCAYDFLRKSVPQKGMDIETFNDRSTTTKKDVLDLFKRAIAAAQKMAKAPSRKPKGAITR